MNIADSTAARNSATIMEIQMPSTSNMSGRSITAAIWNTSVLKNDIIYVEEETYDDIELMARLYKASGILLLSFPRQ